MMKDAAFWTSLSHALIAIGLVLMGAAVFLFYKMRLHKYIAIRQRQRMMGMPPAKKERRKNRKKTTEEQAKDRTGEGQTDNAEPSGPVNSEEDVDGHDGTTNLAVADEDGHDGTTSLSGSDEDGDGGDETTYLTDEEKEDSPSEGHSITEELDELDEFDDQPGTTLLDKEQKEEADRLENGGTWIPASKTFRITKTVIITHGKEGVKNNG